MTEMPRPIGPAHWNRADRRATWRGMRKHIQGASRQARARTWRGSWAGFLTVDLLAEERDALEVGWNELAAATNAAIDSMEASGGGTSQPQQDCDS